MDHTDDNACHPDHPLHPDHKPGELCPYLRGGLLDPQVQRWIKDNKRTYLPVRHLKEGK